MRIARERFSPVFDSLARAPNEKPKECDMRVYIRDTENGRQFLCSNCFETSPYVAVTQWTPEDTAYLSGSGGCRDCDDLLFDTTVDVDALFSPYRNLR